MRAQVGPIQLSAPARFVHDRHVLDVWLPAGPRPRVHEDRARHVFLQLLVDLPHHFLPRFNGGFHRLLLKQRFQIFVAVVRVVALRIAAVILVKGLVRIVDAIAG